MALLFSTLRVAQLHPLTPKNLIFDGKKFTAAIKRNQRKCDMVKRDYWTVLLSSVPREVFQIFPQL